MISVGVIFNKKHAMLLNNGLRENIKLTLEIKIKYKTEFSVCLVDQLLLEVPPR